MPSLLSAGGCDLLGFSPTVQLSCSLSCSRFPPGMDICPLFDGLVAVPSQSLDNCAQKCPLLFWSSIEELSAVPVIWLFSVALVMSTVAESPPETAVFPGFTEFGRKSSFELLLHFGVPSIEDELSWIAKSVCCDPYGQNNVAYFTNNRTMNNVT